MLTKNHISMQSEQSRRDGILLTVDFNLRTKDTAHLLQVPQGRHFGIIVSSLRVGCKKYENILKNIRSLLSHRDRILVENRFVCEWLRAVRYAISSLYIMSLTGHTMWMWTHYFYQYFVPNGTSSNISERDFIKKTLHFLYPNLRDCSPLISNRYRLLIFYSK